MNRKIVLLVIILSFCFSLFSTLLAQTTGKVAGYISDASSNEPLAGANVIIENTNMGASTGLDGTFFIINVQPGSYVVSVEMIGYETVRVENVNVSVNRTFTIDVALKPTIMEGEVIVVQADRLASQKDQTSSIRTVSSKQIDVLPVENLSGVIGMQAGVVNGHFRGGRSNEVSYLIDGLQVDDAFSGEGRRVELETETIQDLEVITGTFNAEYGRAMSGVVNAVTKDGSNEFSASFSSAFANYFTSNDHIFIGLKNSELNRNQDYKFQVSGPVLKNKLYFFINTRYQDNKNHLNGIRRFNPQDFSDFTPVEANEFSIFQPDNPWGYSEHTGDSSYVPMNGSKNLSLFSKLTYRMFDNLRLSFLYTRNDDEWHGYNHAYKYNPDGNAWARRNSDLYLFQVNHMLSKSAFYELKLSYLDNYDGWYLYKDPTDSRYIADAYRGNQNYTGFFTGGQEKGHSETLQRDFNAKMDLSWQITSRHMIKTGVLYTHHQIINRWREIRNLYEQDEELTNYWEFDQNGHVVYPYYQASVRDDTTRYADIYDKKPIEISAYIQDKMEYEDMVINIGVRLDYFDPKTVYPSNRRNPDANPRYQDNPATRTDYLKADPKIQISPRLGLAYQLGSKAKLHFSYGHFFQMPPMSALYTNNSFLYWRPDHSATMGNAQIKAQKTVKYEIGLGQELMQGIWLDVVLFYSDIYDLQSAEVQTAYNQTRYGLYSNKDYGNAKGLEIKVDFQYQAIYSYLNYTLQYTRGNADNPTQTFNRAGGNMDPVNRLIPMSWDQRHTLNLTVGYARPDYGITMTAYYNSGAPYTWTPIEKNFQSRVNLYPNNDYRPSRYTLDMNAFYRYVIFRNIELRFTLNVYNLLDRLNEEWVYGRTGRAYTDVIEPSDLGNHRSDFNDYEDRIKNPSAYSAPRLVKFGFGVSF